MHVLYNDNYRKYCIRQLLVLYIRTVRIQHITEFMTQPHHWKGMYVYMYTYIAT